MTRQDILDEVTIRVTNPDPVARDKAIRNSMVALDLVATKYNRPINEIWPIIRQFEDVDDPWDEPEHKTPDEQLFWDWMAEFDLLPF